MDEAEARALLAFQGQVSTLQRHVESLTCRVAALIELLPPDRFREYEALYAEIYARAAGDASIDETLSRMRQEREGEPDPPENPE